MKSDSIYVTPMLSLVTDDGGWNCSCASNGIAQASGTFHDAGCFSSCNCTSGMFPFRGIANHLINQLLEKQ